MPHWDSMTFLSQQLCKLIRQRKYQPKLLERCFNGPILERFQPILKRFQGWIHVERWATVSFSIPELRRVERIMRLGWCKNKFQQGVDATGAAATGKEESLKLANDCDSVLNPDSELTPFYWAYLVVQESICKFMMQATIFIESCPCHREYLAADSIVPDDFKKEMARQWARCPFRGNMVAELSKEFFEMLGDLCRASSAELLAALPNDITAADRLTCLNEFETGRAHVCLTYTLKLQHLSEPPHAYFKIASLDPSVALAAADLCIASTSQHPLVLHLQSPPMQLLVERWRTGANLFSPDLRPLCDYIAKARFALSNDRPGEGQHAKISSRGRAAPCHTECYQSFFLRAPELERLIIARPVAAMELAACCSLCSNNLRCSEIIGLSAHPSLQAKRRDIQAGSSLAKFCQHTAHAKVVYHADPYTLYTESPPALEFYDYSGGGGMRPLQDYIQGHGAEEGQGVFAIADCPADGDHENHDDFWDVAITAALAPAQSATLEQGLSGILMPYLQDHLHHQWNSKPGTLFSVSMPGSSSSLQSLVSAMNADDGGQPLLRDIPLAFSPHGERRMFFEIVRWNPSQVKRVRTHALKRSEPPRNHGFCYKVVETNNK